MPKWLVLSNGGHNHDPRARTDPLKPNWLTCGDLGYKTSDRGLFVAVLGFC